MSRGISGGKQVIKFTNTSNRGRVCLFYQTRRRFHNHAKCIHRVLARFTPLLFTMRTSTVATAYNKVTMITSTHILTLSSLRWNGLHFLFSQDKQTQPRFLLLPMFFTCLPPWENQQSRPQRWRVIVNNVYLAERKAVIYSIGTRNNDFKKDELLFLIYATFCTRGGGGIPYDGLYPTGRLPPKGAPFSGFRYMKG